MSDRDNRPEPELYEDVEQAVRAASVLVRDAAELATATVTTTWHLTKRLRRVAVAAGREIARAAGSDVPTVMRPIGRVVPLELSDARRHEHVITTAEEPPARPVPPSQLGPADLRRRGDELLDSSADVGPVEDDPHPSFGRILSDIAPDEARILRFLAEHGPQPSVDVRTNRPFDIGSEKVAEGLSMIGELAGCRYADRTHAYFSNLHRLGLVWFSKEQVEPNSYQVIEVQPAVLEATKRAGRAAKIVRRSIHLTPFGENFCRTCFTLD